MSRLIRSRMPVLGSVLLLAIAGAGWTLYLLERQKAMRLTSQLAEAQPDATAHRQYRETVRKERAIRDMREIETAYKVYYLREDRWPDAIDQVTPYLERGAATLIDPWGTAYSAAFEEVKEGDAGIRTRLVVTCQSPDGGPPLRYPPSQ
jgi:hypothetical protein